MRFKQGSGKSKFNGVRSPIKLRCTRRRQSSVGLLIKYFSSKTLGRQMDVSILPAIIIGAGAALGSFESRATKCSGMLRHH